VPRYSAPSVCARPRAARNASYQARSQRGASRSRARSRRAPPPCPPCTLGDELGEGVRHQPVHLQPELGGLEELLPASRLELAHVVAPEQRVDDRREGRRPADARRLELLDQPALVVARRRRGLLLEHAQVVGGEHLPGAERRQDDVLLPRVRPPEHEEPGSRSTAPSATHATGPLSIHTTVRSTTAGSPARRGSGRGSSRTGAPPAPAGTRPRPARWGGWPRARPAPRPCRGRAGRARGAPRGGGRR
jgi:hypothetical protein